MESDIAKKIAIELGVSEVAVVREEWELLILNEISKHPLGDALIFKGGTALRLAYGLPRFSQDLDFDLVGKSASFKAFENLCRGIESKFSILLEDIADKHFTWLAEFKISEGFLIHPFRIKLEISKRKNSQKNLSEIVLLKSQVTSLEVVFSVMTLKQIFQEKTLALKTRRLPKDLFDLWYVSRRLDEAIDLSSFKLQKKDLDKDLKSLLPKNYWKVLEELSL